MPSIASLKEGGSAALAASEKAKKNKTISNIGNQLDFIATWTPFFSVTSGG
jgi:hypothetical protein